MTTRVSCSNWSSWRLRRSCGSSGLSSSATTTAILVLVGLLGGRAQPAERLADDPRDLHLAHADLLADLRLREVFLEAQPQHLALACGDRPEQPVQGRAVL